MGPKQSNLAMRVHHTLSASWSLWYRNFESQPCVSTKEKDTRNRPSGSGNKNLIWLVTIISRQKTLAWTMSNHSCVPRGQWKKTPGFESTKTVDKCTWPNRWPEDMTRQFPGDFIPNLTGSNMKIQNSATDCCDHLPLVETNDMEVALRYQQKKHELLNFYLNFLVFCSARHPPSLHLSTAPGLARACCTYGVERYSTWKRMCIQEEITQKFFGFLRIFPGCIDWLLDINLDFWLGVFQSLDIISMPNLLGTLDGTWYDPPTFPVVVIHLLGADQLVIHLTSAGKNGSEKVSLKPTKKQTMNELWQHRNIFAAWWLSDVVCHYSN